VETITNLVDEKSLQRYATSGDFRLGKEIAAHGGVEIIEYSPLKVIAKVQPSGGQKRTVELLSTEEGLRCKCT
jgi:hypothetical protein